MANNDIQYTYISKLPEADALSSDDLLVVSQLSNEETNEYASYSVKYSTISSNMFDAVSATMSSLTDLAISANVVELSGKIDELSSKIDICLSACVALDNCRNKVLCALQTLQDEVSRLTS